ncbi:transporter [Bacteroidia bacterium]|nr:transporter [Bacteroidia bacterium]
MKHITNVISVINVIAGLTRNPLKLMAVAFCLLLPIASPAQKVWTLEECIKQAQDFNIDIKQRELQIETAEVDLHTSRMSRLPNLNASIGDNVSMGRAQIDDGSATPRITTQTTSNTSASLGASMPIFTGFRISNEVARDKLDVEAAYENLNKAKEDLAINVTGQFLQVLFSKETLKINEEQLFLSKNQAEKTELMVNAGKVARAELSDVQAQVSKDQVAVVEARNNLNLALLNLAQFLELDFTPDFDVAAPNAVQITVQSEALTPPSMLYGEAVGIKPVIKEQEFRLQSAEKAISIAQSANLPSLSLDMGVSTSYFYTFDGVNKPIAEQLKDRLNEYVGLSLQIPIFNRFATSNQIKKARINVESQQFALDNAKKTLYKEIQTAYQNALAAVEKYKASEVAMRATEESYRGATERYETGKISIFEFNEAKTKWKQTQVDCVQTKYEYVFRTKILDFYANRPISL